MTLQGDWLAGHLNIDYPESTFGVAPAINKPFKGIIKRFEVNSTSNKNLFWGLSSVGRTGTLSITKTKQEVNGRIEFDWVDQTAENNIICPTFFQPFGTAPYTISPANDLPKSMTLTMAYGSDFREVRGAVIDSLTISGRSGEIIRGEISFLAKLYSNVSTTGSLSDLYADPIIATAGNVNITTDDTTIDALIVDEFKITFKNNVAMHHDTKATDNTPTAATAGKFEAQLDLTFLEEGDYIHTVIDNIFSQIVVTIGNMDIKFKNCKITSPIPIKISEEMGIRKATYTFVPTAPGVAPVEVTFNA